MDSVIDLSDASKALNLENIRFQLIRLEDTIIFHLIERVKFPLNPTVYKPGGVKTPTSKFSLLEYMLSETERCHSRVRRYQAPDEYPFFPEVLEQPMLEPLEYPKVLHPNKVNVNQTIMNEYVGKILPNACRDFGREDRGEAGENYGSSAVCDVLCLQALSQRIHFGKFVAESKFQKETDRFIELIHNKDRVGIESAITNLAVEAQVLERLRVKATAYGKDPSSEDSRPGKINVDAVVAVYKETVIPLTKNVEVEYLMQRLKSTPWERHE